VNVDLSTVKGLETVLHLAPSWSAIETIYRSKGNIPQAFLRGVGLPDNFIAFMHSPVGTALAWIIHEVSFCSQTQLKTYRGTYRFRAMRARSA